MLQILKAATLSCFVLLLCACGQQTEASISEVEEVKEEVAGTFGADFQASKVIPASDLLSSYSAEAIADTVMTTLRGTVDEVCQAKGCWMTIAAGGEEEMMVKFKDYGFFMPKDISGRQVIMNGMAYYEVTPVDELRHYAEDAGKSPEEIAKITEPKRELKFLADGVQLLEGEL